jgi:chaperone required for assembly of F1-ATPase
MKSGVKRFYKNVEVADDPGGAAVLLDGRSVKTPGAKKLVAPTRALAEALADEWRAQADTIDPETMPLTKALNTALDRIAAHRDTIVEELAKYAGSDLLCYRATAPVELVRRQEAAWDPWLDWAAERFGARLAVTAGVTHVEQDTAVLNRLHAAVAAHDDHRLVALHAGITITGSAVLGLAFAAKALSAEATLAAAQVDETYQAELWGGDAEAESVRARRLEDLRVARRYLDLLGAV